MSKKILIVDDAVHIRVLLEQTLEDFEDVGVQVRSVCDGIEAWNTIQTYRPDLIILDVMMPGMSGYEVCERLKNDPNLSHAYVIMLTAKGQTIDHERSIEVGADEYITKPFNPKHLVKRVAAVLDVEVTSALLQ
jgi:two-component system alkaline phosphatase synthesis response regulator PhoP